LVGPHPGVGAGGGAGAASVLQAHPVEHFLAHLEAQRLTPSPHLVLHFPLLQPSPIPEHVDVGVGDGTGIESGAGVGDAGVGDAGVGDAGVGVGEVAKETT